MVKLYKYIALLWLIASWGKEGYASDARIQENDEKTTTSSTRAQALEDLKIAFNEPDTEKLLERIESIQDPKERLSAININDEGQQEFLGKAIAETLNKKTKKNKLVQSYLTPGELIEKEFERKARFQEISDDLEATEKQFCTLKMQYLGDELNKNNLTAVVELIKVYEEIGNTLKKHIEEKDIRALYRKANRVLIKDQQQVRENTAFKLQERQKTEVPSVEQLSKALSKVLS